jgi:hypothetical protein
MAGERHGYGMGMAWARHAMCESALRYVRVALKAVIENDGDFVYAIYCKSLATVV